jgi:hypothetical protein
MSMARQKTDKVPVDWYAEPDLLEDIEKYRLSSFPVHSLSSTISDLLYKAMYGASGRCVNGNGKRENEQR